jgi:cytochrome oxidase Cu insertion factor (SCO1/SenC/PrrC family)
MPVRWRVWSVALVVGIAGGVGIGAATQTSSQAAATIPHVPQIPNPRLDRGTRLNAVAPAFTLTDQFGKKVSLSSFRGKVVVVSFNDPECTTICPLTTTALLEAKKKLGPAAADVQLLGIGANPEATQVKWVRDYSQAHGMLHKWRFLTGSLPRLRRVWSAYGIAAAVVQGEIDHTPATFVVDPHGRETRLFLSQMSYSSVPQLAEVLARGIAAALPGHPRVRNTTSLAPLKLIGPHRAVPLAGFTGAGKTTWLGPHSGAHLLLFFNTWEQEVMNLRADLKQLNRYAATKSGVPLVAIDEATVESSKTALHDFFFPRSGSDPLSLDYAVVVDSDGRVADGYGVQDSPWLTLVSGSGKILWSYDVAAKGWPSTTRLVNHVHAALAHARG